MKWGLFGPLACHCRYLGLVTVRKDVSQYLKYEFWARYSVGFDSETCRAHDAVGNSASTNGGHVSNW